MKTQGIIRTFLGGVLPLMLFFSCGTKPRSTEIDPLVSHIDSTVRPGDDFFDYANGGWFRRHPIPPSEQSNGIWQLIQDTINNQIRDVCISAASKVQPEGSNKQKIGDFFYSGMDSVALNKNGIRSMQPDLQQIERIANMSDLMANAAFVHRVSSSPFFNFYVVQDDKNSSKYAIYIAQGGLSLPDRRYYFDNDAKTKDIREKFVQYAATMFRIMGSDSLQALSDASKLMKTETALASASRKREDTRDPFSNYHKMSLKQLVALTPAIDWNLFINKAGLVNVDSVVVAQPEFLTGLNGLLRKYPLADWKNYLKFHFFTGLSPYLDDKTYYATFNFYSRELRGVKEPKPRWKRVVEETDGALGDLIGQVYVSEYLPKGTKEKLLEIGNAIKTVFAERIRALDWMSETTKEKALKKLNAVVMKVGYPDKWKDMSALKLDRNSYVKNVMSANKWEWNFMINKYGKPVDRTLWDMEPQTYNAYYNPSNNEIVIPGCNIIVPGYERKMADDAILYGIIGGTFGHEITHGFDDQGAKYDANGNLSNWWTSQDSIRFYNKTKMIVRQFDNYIAVDNLHINGALTQGENIADLGGVVMSYEAFRKTRQFRNNKKTAGFTPAQRFFLGYALGWMVNMRPEAIVTQVKSNEHAPAKWRVIGPLSDMTEFYNSFNVKQGDKMWRPDSLRVRIW